MKNDKTYKLVMTALMLCIVAISTMAIKVPVPFTQGYVHLGDAAIFLSVLILGKERAAIAAGVGSALADVLGGYAYFAPWTLIVKALMAFIMGLFLEYMQRRGHSRSNDSLNFIEVIGMAIGGIEMALGYYLVESVMYNSFVVPLPAIPANIGQFVVGMILASLIATALYKTPAKKYFAIK